MRDHKLRIFTADGEKTEFPRDAKWYWHRDAIKLEVESILGRAGWHQDRLAYMIHEQEPLSSPPEIDGCIVRLRLSEGQLQELKLKALYRISMDIGNNFLRILGRDADVIINLDYLQSYQINNLPVDGNNNQNGEGISMTQEQDKKAIVVDIFGERQDFNSSKEFRLNTTQSTLIITHSTGIFYQHLDKMRYCILEVENQNAEYRYDACHLTLTDGKNNAPEKMTLERIIKIDWNANTGLLAIHGVSTTAIFHLDYVISYQLLPKSG